MANREELEKKREELRQKSKGFFGEFKEFVLRGNVMDMAIGVIIGGAFQGIVSALTEDFINPLINGIGGAEVGGTLKIYGGQVIKYGDFITAVINFLIMALVLFILLKIVNGIMEEDSILDQIYIYTHIDMHVSYFTNSNNSKDIKSKMW